MSALAQRLAFAASLGIATLGACSGTSAPRDPPGTIAVLMIGNSLTDANQLPGMIEALSESLGTKLRVHTAILHGAALEDHWSSGSARVSLRSRDWHFVVLQQGPSALETSRVHLREWTARFATEIRSAGGRPALYMVWPMLERFGDFDRVAESYTLAAADVDGLLLPVGDAWRAAWRRDPDLALYGPDDFHPSVAGSYLAALVMHARLSGTSPVGAPARVRVGGVVLGVDDATAAVLQDAAAEAIAAAGDASRARPVP